MPTELPTARIAAPEPSASGTLAFVAAALLMILLSYTTLKQGDDAVPASAPQAQGV